MCIYQILFSHIRSNASIISVVPPLVFIRGNVSVFQDFQSHSQTPLKSGKATMVVGINSLVVTHKIICGRDSENIFEQKF